MRRFTIVILFLFILVPSTSNSFDLNLININTGSPSDSSMASSLGKPFGFSGDQVAPAMTGPAQEVPAILQIAQAAGTVPVTVWMMRRMGFSYSRILQTFNLSPTVLLGNEMGSQQAFTSSRPQWNQVLNPFYIQIAKLRFLNQTIGLTPAQILAFSPESDHFYKELQPWMIKEKNGWLPPGQAMKQGLWLPPGIAKKQEWRIDGNTKKPQKRNEPTYSASASLLRKKSDQEENSFHVKKTEGKENGHGKRVTHSRH